MARRIIVVIVEISLLSLVLCQVGLGEPPPIVQKAVFDVEGAHIVVYVPWDLRSGELVSGAIEVMGKESGKRALAGFRIDVNGTVYSLSSPYWSRSLALNARSLRLQLRDKAHHVVGLALFKVDPSIVKFGPSPLLGAPLPTLMARRVDFKIPRFAVQGRPFRILGPYNGKIQDDVVWIDGKKISLLAESPRAVVARAPSNLSGAHKIQLWEAGQTESSVLPIVEFPPEEPKISQWQVLSDQDVRTERITADDAIQHLCTWVRGAQRDLESYADSSAKSGGDREEAERARKASAVVGDCCVGSPHNLSATRGCVVRALSPVTKLTTGEAVWSRGATYLKYAMGTEADGNTDCMLIESTLTYLGRLAGATSHPKLGLLVSQARGVCRQVWLGERPKTALDVALESIKRGVTTLEHSAATLRKGSEGDNPTD